MRIVIDRDACIGAASCVAIAQQTFNLDQEGKVYILHEKRTESGELDAATVMGDAETVVQSDDTPEMDPRDVIIEGARSCPVFAIKLYEDDGTEIVL